MAYVAVEADERLEEGPDGLEFKSFLESNAGGARPTSRNVGRGYMTDVPSRKTPAGFWSVEFYQPYFDVDTITVLQRCYTTLLPWSSSYLSTFSGGVDLYGTFWVPTTLILALFIIASYLSAPGSEYDYDFALLGLATTIVYAYAFGLPIALWLVLRYLGVDIADAKATRLLIVLVAALHAALALTFKIIFFSYYVVADTGPGTDPTP
ncbi:Yip1-domain-containing protein [Pisolithus sp. B1]|nr:Yip1-domain-containing protein [Pisolithus sp. B1]